MSFVVRTTIKVGPSYWMDLDNSTKSRSLVLEEYRKRQVFLSSSRILLFRNRIETLSKTEQSGWNPTGVGIKGASSAAVKKYKGL